MEKIKINKKQEILALTLSILRLCPLYNKYHRNKATVTLDWDKPNNKVTVTYTHHEILLYQVGATVFSEDKVPYIKLELLQAPKLTPAEEDILRTIKVMSDLYELMGVITRKVWMNNQDVDEEPTATIAIRKY